MYPLSSFIVLFTVFLFLPTLSSASLFAPSLPEVSFRGQWASGNLSMFLNSRSREFETPHLLELSGTLAFRYGKYSSKDDMRTDLFGLYNSSSGYAFCMGYPRLSLVNLDFYSYEQEIGYLEPNAEFFSRFLSDKNRLKVPCLLGVELYFDPFQHPPTRYNFVHLDGFGMAFNLTNGTFPHKICPNVENLIPETLFEFSGVDRVQYDRQMFFYSIICFVSSLLVLTKPVLNNTVKRWFPFYLRLVPRDSSSSDIMTEVSASLFGHLPTFTSFTLASIDFCLFIFNLTWALVVDSPSAALLGFASLLMFAGLVYIDKYSIIARTRAGSRFDRSSAIIIPICAFALFLFASGLSFIVLIAAAHVYFVLFIEIAFFSRGQAPCFLLNTLSALGRLVVPGYFLLYSDNFLLMRPEPIVFWVMCGLVVIGIFALQVSRSRNSICGRVSDCFSRDHYDPLNLPDRIIDRIKNPDDTDPINCTICLEDLLEEDLTNKRYIFTRCSHLFHKSCLTRYANESSSPTVGCPICRSAL
ncbi:hypothetical protein P9112_012188 [Eukaryota sp. TZLM1-RC]